MTETATVLKNNGSTVLLGCGIDSETCKSCAGSAFCNVRERTYEAVLDAGITVQPGDTVRVYLPPGKTILAGFMVLIVPLILFLLFYFAAERFLAVEGEGQKALAGVCGLFLGFLMSYLLNRRKHTKNMPRIIGKTDS